MALTVKPQHRLEVSSNVSITNPRTQTRIEGYYDVAAERYGKITILPDSILSDNQDTDLWMARNIEELLVLGYLEQVSEGYRVKKMICGTPSGTVAIALRKDGPNKPNGYKEWTYDDGRSLK